jgi:hypothetical protein
VARLRSEWRKAVAVAMLAGVAGWLAWGQRGAPARQASPEIVRQMAKEAKTGLSATQSQEITALHAADAREMQLLLALERKYLELDRLMQSFDYTLDSRTLIADHERLRVLEEAHAKEDAERKGRQDAEDRRWETIKTSTVVLMISTFASLLLAVVKWGWDRLRRRRAGAVVDTRDAERLAVLHEVKATVLAATEQFGPSANIAAGARIGELADEVRFLGKRVDRLGSSAAGGGMPTT